LQHSCSLSGDQPIDQNDLTIREFKRIMNVWIVQIDLPKSCNPVFHGRLSKATKGVMVSDMVLERQLSAGKLGHTATSGSPTAAKPLVIAFGKSVATSSSPTFAACDATL